MEACATQLGTAARLEPRPRLQVHVDLTDPRQRALYDRRFQRRFRMLRSWLRQDEHDRARRMESALARRGLALEDLKVFEMGFGAGELLLRCGTSCRLHGCDPSESAVLALGHDARAARYRERTLALSGRSGAPAFPSSAYDLVIASRGLEDATRRDQTLASLLRHTRPGGYGVFFLDSEAPNASGFARALRAAGWTLLERQTGGRLASYLKKPAAAAVGPFARLGGLLDRAARAVLGLTPAAVRPLCEAPLAALRVSPSRLMLVARRPG